jgi:hypothetical protein
MGFQTETGAELIDNLQGALTNLLKRRLAVAGRAQTVNKE